MFTRSVLTLSGIILVASSVQAQTLSVGPMIGGNIATVAGASNTKGLLGPSIGGFVNYSVNDHVGFSLKAMYAGLGTAFDGNAERIRLHYIQVPLTAVYYFGEIGDAFRPKVFAGGYVAPLIQANNQNGNEILGPDGASAYQNFDFGGVIGGGFNYRILSRMWLNVDAGFTRGATDITKNKLNFQNSAFQGHVGISFPLGKN